LCTCVCLGRYIFSRVWAIELPTLCTKLKGCRIPLLDPNFLSRGIGDLCPVSLAKQAWFSLVHILRFISQFIRVQLVTFLSFNRPLQFVWRSSNPNAWKCEWQRVVERLML
jgi:hypothetical protein